MNEKKENQNNYIKITIGNKSQDLNNISFNLKNHTLDNLIKIPEINEKTLSNLSRINNLKTKLENVLNSIEITTQEQKLKELEKIYSPPIDSLKSKLNNMDDLLNNIIGIKSSEQKFRELAAKYNREQEEKYRNLLKSSYLKNLNSFSSIDLKSIHNSMNNYYAAIHPSYRNSLKNFLETNFSYLLKNYFSQDYLEHFKSSIDKTIFETFENTIIEKTYIKTDEKLSLKEKIEFLFNTATNIYNSLENRLKTEQAKDLLNTIYSNLDFMNYITLEDLRITRPQRFFNFLKDSFLNSIDDEKKTYSLLEKIIINFLLYYDKFYEINEFAKKIRNFRFKDILRKYKNIELDDLSYIAENFPLYNKNKYQLIINLINIISIEFNLNFQDVKQFFLYLIVEQEKQSKVSNAKKQLNKFTPNENFINFLTTFDY